MLGGPVLSTLADQLSAHLVLVGHAGGRHHITGHQEQPWPQLDAPFVCTPLPNKKHRSLPKLQSALKRPKSFPPEIKQFFTIYLILNKRQEKELVPLLQGITSLAIPSGPQQSR